MNIGAFSTWAARQSARVLGKIGLWGAAGLFAGLPLIGVMIAVPLLDGIVLAPASPYTDWFPDAFSMVLFGVTILSPPVLITLGLFHAGKQAPGWFKAVAVFAPLAIVFTSTYVLEPYGPMEQASFSTAIAALFILPALPALFHGPKGGVVKMIIGGLGVAVAIPFTVWFLVAVPYAFNEISPGDWQVVLLVGLAVVWGDYASVMFLHDGMRGRAKMVRRGPTWFPNLDEHYIQGHVTKDERDTHRSDDRRLREILTVVHREAHSMGMLKRHGIGLLIAGLACMALAAFAIPSFLVSVNACPDQPFCMSMYDDGDVLGMGIASGYTLGLGLFGIAAGGLAHHLVGSREEILDAEAERARAEVESLSEEMIETIRERVQRERAAVEPTQPE